MSAADCRYFDTCSAPLCPMDLKSLQLCAWFADEDVCRRADYTRLHWVRRQKKIASITSKDPARGCFSHAMLCQDCRLTRRLRGLDPSVGEINELRVHRWILEHPKITEEYRAALAARAANMRRCCQGLSEEKAPDLRSLDPLAAAGMIIVPGR
jgi:hypothetical protein